MLSNAAALSRIDNLQNELQSIKLELAKPIDTPVKQLSQEFLEEHQQQWIETGDRFRQHRKSLGLTVADIAREMDTCKSKVSNFENGKPIAEARMFERAYLHVLQSYEFMDGFVVGQRLEKLSEYREVKDIAWGVDGNNAVDFVNGLTVGFFQANSSIKKTQSKSVLVITDAYPGGNRMAKQ